MGLGGPLARDKIGQRELAVLPLSLHVIDEARLVMARDTIDMPVAGGLPGINEDLHVVADPAKKGRFGEFEEGSANDNKTDQNEGQK